MNSPAFELDDDDLPTSVNAEPFDLALSATPPPARHDSYVGFRPQADAQSVPEAVIGRHNALSAAILDLEETCKAFDSVDTSASAAQHSLRCRVGSLSLLCSALEATVSQALDPALESLFAGDGLLAPHLAGVYMWAGDLTETLGTLARDLNNLSPDWATFRQRLDDVRWIFDMTTAEGRKLSVVPLPAELRDALDELLVCAVSLDARLSEPFG